MSMHESDLSGEVDLLHTLLDDAREYIRRMREELGLVKPVLKVVGEGELPTRSYTDDAGLDLYASEGVTIGHDEFMDVPCGISVELPRGYWGLIVGRSSTLRRRGLMVSQGVIDTGYRGPLFAGVWALNRGVRISKGERLAQLIIFANSTERISVERVAQLGPSSRGESGFGSSGF